MTKLKLYSLENTCVEDARVSDPEHIVETRELLELARQTIERLPSTQTACLLARYPIHTLKFPAGETLAETAERFSRSRPWAYGQSQKAIDSLREAFEVNGASDDNR